MNTRAVNTAASSVSNIQIHELPPERFPKHIAVIMDGNGRWAQRQGLPRIEGHRQGVNSVRRTVEECARLKIRQLTLYCLSSENWKRPQHELDFLMQLLKQYMIEERESIMKNGVRVLIIGRRDGIPEQVQQEMDETIRLSQNNQGTTLCLAINYGGRGEMVDAVQNISQKVADGTLQVDGITEEVLANHLYTSGMPDPDLLIRTAGEMRISNFLLWQISYSELWVTDLCWPEFEESTLQDAILNFASRDRRFGGLSKDSAEGVDECSSGD